MKFVMSFIESLATLLLAPLTLVLATGLLITAAYIRRQMTSQTRGAKGVFLWTGQMRLGA